jgi:hypothetical protein
MQTTKQSSLLSAFPFPKPADHVLIMAQPDALQAHGREDVACGISVERRQAGARFIQELLG